MVSLIVAARNEEERVLRQAVQGFLEQDYPNLEVVAVDDRSTDGTLHILDDLASRNTRLKVLQAGDPPPGWTGKNHALHRAIGKARGEWLLATDADILFAPGAVTAALRAARDLDVLSLWPRIECGSFWERLILPVDLAVTEALFPLDRVNDPGCPDGMTIGGFILMRRSALEGIGGYQAVRDQIAEDAALGKLFKTSGYRLRLVHAPDLLWTRDYSNLTQIWGGLTRKLLSQLPYVPMFQRLRSRFSKVPRWRDRGSFPRRLAFGLATLLSAVMVLAPTVLPWVLLLSPRPALAVPAGFGCWAVYRWHRKYARLSGIPRVYSVFAPFGFALFVAMMASASLRVITGRGLAWRGRRIY